MTIAHLGITATSNAGAAAVDLDKLSTSANKAELNTKKLAASSKLADTATGHLSAELRGAAAAAQQATQAVDSTAAAQGRAAVQTRVFGQAVQTNRFHTANLAAQFNDIGLMMASGQSPMLLALQQGTQVSQVLNTMGTSGVGAVRALGTAFLSVINPISLVTIGTIAAGAAAFQWFMSMRDEVEKTEDVLERHDRLIGRIGDHYGEAASKAMEFSRDTRLLLEADLRASRLALQAAERAASDSFLDIVGNEVSGQAKRGAFDGFKVIGEYKAFASAIADLRQEVQAGDPDWARFQQRIDEIARTAPDASRETADKLILATREAYALSEALSSASVEARGLSGSLSFGGVSDGIARLQALMPELRSTREQAQDIFAQEIGTAVSSTEVTALVDAFDRLNVAFDEQDRRRKAARQLKMGNGAGDAWAAANDNFDRRIAQQRMELSLLGQSTFEIERQRAEFDLLTQAKQAGIAIGQEELSLIREKANVYATATTELEMHTEAIRRQNEAYEFHKATFKSFAMELKGNLREGQGLWDSFANAAVSALDRIADRALGMAADGIFDLIFSSPKGGFGGGGFGGGLGGLIASLFSFDGGGHTGYGPRSGGLDGKGGFPAILHPNETVIDHTMGSPANSNGGVNVHINVGRIVANSEAEGAAAARGLTRTARREVAQMIPSAIEKYHSNPHRRLG